MKRDEGLALIRRAGYIGNFKSMIELRVSYRISHNVALREFNIGRYINKKEVAQINFENSFSLDVLNNS